jgi:hypothetical protein
VIDKDAIRELIKASFSGDRSAAGRYAAEQRWKGHVKTEVKAPLSPKARDITEELKTYFGKTMKQYLKSEGYQEVNQRLIDKQKQNTGLGDLQLEEIAKKQGFDGKPKVVSKEAMDKLEKEGWTIAYRGIQDLQQEGDLGVVKAEELAEQFRTGEYFAGFGRAGNGIYFAKDEEVAQRYAEGSSGREEGEVIKVAIPPNALMSENNFRKELSKHKDLLTGSGSGYVGKWYGDDDMGRKLASQGERGVELSLNFGVGTDKAPAFIIFDRSMLAVEESTKTK